jgi:predicted metal-binding membrane protein
MHATTERVLRHDRAVVALVLLLVVAVAWAYTVHTALATGVEGMVMPHIRPWDALDFLLMFAMWAAMMTAMMLPSAAPMILVLAAVVRRRAGAHSPHAATALFTLAYVVVWVGFALLATLTNWILHQAGAMTSMMGNAVPVLGGVILLGAGVYQWTPAKHACLNRCRSPLAFLMTEWREGSQGVFVMGVRHGLYCLGCCWALMGLLFVVGVMNLLWIAALAGVALAEKILPAGAFLSRGVGTLLIAAGLWMLATPLLQ